MASSPDDPPLTPTVLCDSPDDDSFPPDALGPSTKYTRCVSTASNFSQASATSTSSSHVRESLGSDISAFSRQSSGSYQSNRLSDISTNSHVLRYRQSTGSLDTANIRSGGGASRRRGFMRPQGTDFAASARSRESVLSLGSIAHLQYYFARTGLLDGKGGQLARKRQQKAKTLDLSALNSPTFLTTPKIFGNDHDSSYASMGSSPDLVAHSGFSPGGLGPESVVESPIEDRHADDLEDGYYSDGFDEQEAPMLPPTASTYNYREKPLPKPPTIYELRADLNNALDTASKALNEAKNSKSPSETTTSEEPAPQPDQAEKSPSAPGWHEIQGMHILDVMTLAIRAAKIYYTTHERPDRLDVIKSEKEIRSELLSVMDVLKRMATRGFVGGMRDDEFHIMDGWISGLHALLATEHEMEVAEAVERKSWTWLDESAWEDRPFAREEAFMRSMLAGSSDPVKDMVPLPTWTPIDRSIPLERQTLPTEFLASLQNGIRLVQLHNCAVRKSRRRFGAIPNFHTDTQKPYRAADNLRYWIKAAELRWEVLLKADPLGLQYNSSPQLWVDFEDAVFKWCGQVREEITADLSRRREGSISL